MIVEVYGFVQDENSDKVTYSMYASTVMLDGNKTQRKMGVNFSKGVVPKVGHLDVTVGDFYYLELQGKTLGTSTFYPMLAIEKYEKTDRCIQLDNGKNYYKYKKNYNARKMTNLERIEVKDEVISNRYQGYNKPVKKKKEKTIEDIFDW